MRLLLVGLLSDLNVRDSAVSLARNRSIDLSILTTGVPQTLPDDVGRDQVHRVPLTTRPWFGPIHLHDPFIRRHVERVIEPRSSRPDAIVMLGISELLFLPSIVGDVFDGPMLFIPQGGETARAVGDVGWKSPLRYPQRKGYRWNFRRMLSEVDEVWGADSYRSLFRDLGFDVANYRSFDPFPYDDALFTARGPSEDYGLDEDTVVVGTFRRRRYPQYLERGYETLIRAADDLRDDGVDFHLVIGGGHSTSGGEEMDERIRQMVDRCRLDDWVSFVGKVPKDDLPAYLRGLDVYVDIPFVGYSLGGVIGTTSKEAMACGCAFVRSEDPPVDHTLEDGVNAELFETHQPAALAERLRDLIAHPEVLDARAEAARSLVEATFSGGAMTDRWRENIEELLKATAR